MYTAYTPIAALAAVTLVFASIAIRRSPQKPRTALYIVAAILACGVIGTVIGLASVNLNTAYFLVWLFAGVAVTTAIQFIGLRRRSRKFQTAFYIVTVTLACAIVGAVIRLAFANSHAAGILAALLAQAGGIAVSIEQIRRYRNSNIGLT